MSTQLAAISDVSRTPCVHDVHDILSIITFYIINHSIFCSAYISYILQLYIFVNSTKFPRNGWIGSGTLSLYQLLTIFQKC
jgi:hypothetical protein